MECFENFCGRIQRMIADEKTISRKIENGRDLVSELLSRQNWFFDYLKTMILEPSSFEGLRPGIWPNEYTLYRSPDRSYVVLAYIWEAKLSDVIHDHGSWGIIGTLCARLGERKYERIDDGKREGYAELRETGHGVCGPGETTFVLPLNKGLHAMDNPTDGIAVSINVYGKSIRQGYIQFFDPEKKTVTRAFPPRTLKEVLAVKTLTVIDPSRAEGVLREALGMPRPPQLKQEYEATLARIRGK
jgi:predicted metal-dependent enzyme (double-stranded beta helix superfamily)